MFVCYMSSDAQRLVVDLTQFKISLIDPPFVRYLDMVGSLAKAIATHLCELKKNKLCACWPAEPLNTK